MTTKTPEELIAECGAWWDTSIIDIHPGKIAIRGYPIEELIGRVRFPDMIWLMLRGELPTRGQSDLLEAALVPGVDHGPHAPSIAISCMAVSCGLPLNGAMASAINVLDDVHGGAGQQCMELYREIDAAAGADGDVVAAATADHPAPAGRRRQDRARLRPPFPSGRSAHRAAVRPRRQGGRRPARCRVAGQRSARRSRMR